MQGLSFQGQLEGLILAVLGQGPLHGYAIAQRARHLTDIGNRCARVHDRKGN